MPSAAPRLRPPTFAATLCACSLTIAARCERPDLLLDLQRIERQSPNGDERADGREQGQQAVESHCGRDQRDMIVAELPPGPEQDVPPSGRWDLRRMIGQAAPLGRCRCSFDGGRAAQPGSAPGPDGRRRCLTPHRVLCVLRRPCCPRCRHFAARLRFWRPRSPPPRPARLCGAGSPPQTRQRPCRLSRVSPCRSASSRAALYAAPAAARAFSTCSQPASLARSASRSRESPEPFVLLIGRRQRRADRSARRETERAEHQRLLVQRVEEPASRALTIVAGPIARIACPLPQLLARLINPVAGAGTQPAGAVTYTRGHRHVHPR